MVEIKREVFAQYYRNTYTVASFCIRCGLRSSTVRDYRDFSDRLFRRSVNCGECGKLIHSFDRFSEEEEDDRE